jgi:hypothetical protein
MTYVISICYKLTGLIIFKPWTSLAISGLVEIQKNIMIATREEGPLYGMTFGLVAGIFIRWDALYTEHWIWRRS